ncbi:MAG: hypothetical protein AAFV53_40890 [Myxococcota bacterium]
MSPLDSIQRHLDAGRWNEAVVEVRDHDAQRSRRTMRRRGLPEVLHQEVAQAAAGELIAYPASRRARYQTVDKLRTRYHRSVDNAARRASRAHWRGDYARSRSQPDTPEEIVSAHEMMRHLLAEIQVSSDLKDAVPAFRAIVRGSTAQLAQELGVSRATAERRQAAVRQFIRYKLGRRLRRWDPGWSPSLISEPLTRPALRGHRLELRLEQHGGALWARLHCAYARHLAVFVLSDDTLYCVDTLIQGEDDPLIEHRVELPATTERAIAVAVAPIATPEHLKDLPRSDLIFWAAVFDLLIYRLAEGATIEQIESDQHWQLAEASTMRISPDMLQRSSDKIPPPGQAFGAQLLEAGTLAKSHHISEAAALYRQVWQEAHHEEDRGAMVRAAVGAFITLRLLGFVEAAHRILVRLLYAVPLDERWTSWVIREMAAFHLDAGDARGAFRWLTVTSPDDHPPSAGHYYAHTARALLLDGDLKEAEQIIEQHAGVLEQISDGKKRMLFTDRFIAQARSMDGRGYGAPDTLIHEYETLKTRYRGVSPIKRGARWVRARVEAGVTFGDSAVGVRAVAEAREQLMQLGRRQLDRWQQRELLDATEQLSDLYAQRDLIRLAYLHPTIADDVEGYPLLAIAQSAGALLWLSPGRELEMRAPEMVSQVRACVVDAIRELRRDESVEAVRRLGQMIFPEPLEGRVLVASDGLLTEAPLWVAHHAAHPDHPLPVFREVLGPRLDFGATVRRGGIASLADPFGDLPGARAEVSPSQASVYLRDDDVTREALAGVEAGLVVLGVHTQPGRDGRYLEMADGPLYPDQLIGMDMGGAVMYLSGCETAVLTTVHGPELSFAHSLLRAGAGAVVAHGYSVNDSAARQATEILLDQPLLDRDPAEWMRDGLEAVLEHRVPLHVPGAIHLY